MKLLVYAKVAYNSFKHINMRFLPLYIAILVQIGCNKLVQVPEPINTITTSETFATSANATSAITGIYSDMSMAGGGIEYGNGEVTFIAGQSSDELQQFGYFSAYAQNAILANDPLTGNLWSPAYFDIYMANAAVEGINASRTLTTATKNQLIGEAKFIRGFCFFYLTNLFGAVPLTTSTSFITNSLIARAPSVRVYQQIIADLKDAQNMLATDYSVSGGNRVRANKWAATAMLARAYLYQGYWDSAINEASMVIDNSTLFSLDSNLSQIFLANSTESILQLIPVSTNYRFATIEGNQFIPATPGESPNYYLTNQLLSSFEVGDRRISWIDSTEYQGTTYYYPYKYKVQQTTSDNITEYYTLLRLAEQYLIRAEAEAELNQLDRAIADLDIIRTRAGLTDLSSSLTQAQVLKSVEQERRIELFAEWGHRWLDLKRWGTAVSILDTISYKAGHINNNQLLYPIPLSEIQSDPNLMQNAGY